MTWFENMQACIQSDNMKHGLRMDESLYSNDVELENNNNISTVHFPARNSCDSQSEIHPKLRNNAPASD